MRWHSPTRWTLEWLRKHLGIVKSWASRASAAPRCPALAKTLDDTVKAFSSRRLDAGPDTYVWLDALTRGCARAGASSTWPPSPPA